MSHSKLHDLDIRQLTTALEKNTHITSLNIQDNNLGMGSIEALKNNTTLKHLDISHNNLGNQPIEKLIENTHLSSLNILNNKITVQIIESFLKNTTLKTLSISGSEIGTDSSIQLTNHPTLVDLDLGFRKISFEAWHDLLLKIETNQYTDNFLDLKQSNLHDLDVKQLIGALEKNTHITSLNLESNFLSLNGIDMLSNNKTLTSLNLSNNKMGYEGVQILMKNTTLTDLNLSNNHIQSQGAQLLAKNNHLVSLDLSNNELKFEDASHLANNTTLKHLTLSGSEITQAGVANLIGPNSQLVELNDGPNRMSHDLWVKLINAIETNEYTENHLDLHSLNLNDLDVRQLTQALKSNDSITSLNLNDNNICTLGELTNHIKLSTLDIGHNHIGDNAAKALAENTTLTHLNISHNDLGSTSAQLLANHSKLTYLDISSNHIKDIGAQALAQNALLNHLNINNNDLGTLSAVAFSKNNTLKTLNIGSNHIGDEGLIALTNNKILTDLDISINGLSEISMASLASNKNLMHLSVYGNSINSIGILTLVQDTAMTELNIGGNFFDETVLNTLGENNTLISLNLSHNLMPNGEVYLAKYHSDSGDRDFYFSHSADYSSYLAITKISTLTHLDLSFNKGFLFNTELVQHFIDMPNLEDFNIEESGLYLSDVDRVTPFDAYMIVRPNLSIYYENYEILPLFQGNTKLKGYFDTKAYEAHIHHSDDSTDINIIDWLALHSNKTSSVISVSDVLSDMSGHGLLQHTSNHEMPDFLSISTSDDLMIMPKTHIELSLDPIQEFSLG